jgi:predicted SPOUT superfamily RNA methylase MTH1
MASITGPNGTVALGAGSAAADGGISIVMVEDKSTMSIGADGAVMHSLHAGKGANVTVRLMKTSPTNQLLSQMYALDTGSSGVYGFNTISVRDLNQNDVVTCQQCAFGKFADVTYGKEGGEMVWTFHAGITDFVLGSGIAVAAGVV